MSVLWMGCQEDLKTNDLSEEPNVDCVYKALTEKSAAFDALLNEFDGENPIAHLRYTFVDYLEDDVNAELMPTVLDSDLVILLNRNTLPTFPPLYIASAIVHETIHAHITRQLLNIQDTWGKTNLRPEKFMHLSDALDELNYPTLYYYYDRYKVDVHAQHEYMADYYVPYIKKILMEISSPKDEYICEALAWEGLWGYRPFGSEKDVYYEGWENLGIDKRNSLRNIIINYRNNGKRGYVW